MKLVTNFRSGNSLQVTITSRQGARQEHEWLDVEFTALNRNGEAIVMYKPLPPEVDEAHRQAVTALANAGFSDTSDARWLAGPTPQQWQLAGLVHDRHKTEDAAVAAAVGALGSEWKVSMTEQHAPHAREDAREALRRDLSSRFDGTELEDLMRRIDALSKSRQRGPGGT